MKRTVKRKRHVKRLVERRYASHRQRVKALEFSRYRCAYCGEAVDEDTCNIDHVTPWPIGRTKLGNLVAVCRVCNKAKGIMLEVEWLAGLDAVYDERIGARWQHAKEQWAVVEEAEAIVDWLWQ